MSTDTRVRAMTKQDIDRKKEIAALALISKSGVGAILALTSLGPVCLGMVQEIGLAGSESEAIVTVALQFAFTNDVYFRSFIIEQSQTPSDQRKFRVRR